MASAKEIKKHLDIALAEIGIWESVERKTKGRGGKREGAGRPRGTIKSPTKRVTLPKDVAEWLETPSAIPQVRQLIAKSKH